MAALVAFFIPLVVEEHNEYDNDRIHRIPLVQRLLLDQCVRRNVQHDQGKYEA